ncbi:MAG: sigma-54-dependent Fis family transcriptional regulator, partial [Proteobacteria bacterium]|nr:sigma-54-dependent Fis family transcriptional regulator [Pseudomonadota bacterium]
RKEYRKVGSIAPDALRLLFGHSWPGNIRELYNAIEYAFTLSDDTVLQKKHLPDAIWKTADSGAAEVVSPKNEKELILQALQQTNFSKPKAAALLGIHRTTLYRKLKKFNM